MEIRYYPDKDTVTKASINDDPIIMVVSHDKKEVILSNIDDAPEHNILLKKTGHSELDIDKYFRIIVNKSGADWTFVCPTAYKGIENREKRIDTFYNDGIDVIGSALKLTGFNVKIDIPKRYTRHLDIYKENGPGK